MKQFSEIYKERERVSSAQHKEKMARHERQANEEAQEIIRAMRDAGFIRLSCSNYWFNFKKGDMAISFVNQTSRICATFHLRDADPDIMSHASSIMRGDEYSNEEKKLFIKETKYSSIIFNGSASYAIGELIEYFNSEYGIEK